MADDSDGNANGDAGDPNLDLADARDRDAERALAGVAREFTTPPDTYYVDGNSLGPLSDGAAAGIERVVEEWRTLGIDGWTAGEPPWVEFGERIGDRLAPLLGAQGREVVAANSTTVNIHALVGTFLDACDADEPTVLVDELNFPTDRYAVVGQLEARGLDPADCLKVVASPDQRIVGENDIEAAIDVEDPDLVFLPSVLYKSGQRLDVERITSYAKDAGAYVGWDLAHSVGIVPHHLDEHGVDFAVWCGYKYLNGGPGTLAGLYVNERHFDLSPALPGWWGNDPDTRFDLEPVHDPAPGAARHQIGTVPVLSAASLHGALSVYDDVEMRDVRADSLALTDYLVDLVDAYFEDVTVGTPREHSRRGGHVALEHPDADRVSQALKDRGVVVDYRPPNVIRVCPNPFYVTHEDVWHVAAELHDILDSDAHEAYTARSGGVT
ncbi:kynureninase [Halocalculus aciditolerans]|uniref:Kynureninase n=1 Tax=Halocalculus aciditolerans TaxID=1383812 RepID=A0A830FBP7_9EURY|nr:kynureninase [Halocalculus aciditolerans]GGL59002.1 kynureninase [Halocalculus aciditolerans]